MLHYNINTAWTIVLATWGVIILYALEYFHIQGVKRISLAFEYSVLRFA